MNTEFDFDVLNLELEDIVDFDMSEFGFELEDKSQSFCENFIDDLLEKELYFWYMSLVKYYKNTM